MFIVLLVAITRCNLQFHTTAVIMGYRSFFMSNMKIKLNQEKLTSEICIIYSTAYGVHLKSSHLQAQPGAAGRCWQTEKT